MDNGVEEMGGRVRVAACSDAAEERRRKNEGAGKDGVTRRGNGKGLRVKGKSGRPE